MSPPTFKKILEPDFSLPGACLRRGHQELFRLRRVYASTKPPRGLVRYIVRKNQPHIGTRALAGCSETLASASLCDQNHKTRCFFGVGEAGRHLTPKLDAVIDYKADAQAMRQRSNARPETRTSSIGEDTGSNRLDSKLCSNSNVPTC